MVAPDQDIKLVNLSGGPLDGQQASVTQTLTELDNIEDTFTGSPTFGQIGRYVAQTDPADPWLWQVP